MPENPRGITPLNWPTLVAEALRRRKSERLTQREHAALARVSIPTMAAFERGERTLTLAKAFDILRVVGLVDEPADDDAQEVFVRDSFARWQDLTAKLPARSGARFPHGWYRIDYVLEGDLRTVELQELQVILQKAALRNTGWPMFRVSPRAELAPREVDGTLEAWFPPESTGVERAFDGAAHCDFWRATPTGRMFLIRGFQEDDQETFPPGTIFDATLPVWRLSEALLHAVRLAAALKRNAESAITIRFRALFSGLSGRVLRSWANPLSDLFVEGAPARSDEAMLEIVASPGEIEGNLTRHVAPLVGSLFERFSITGPAAGRIENEIERFRKSRTV